MSEETFQKVVPEEGWHVFHLYYRVDHGQWSLLSREEKLAAKTNLTAAVQEARATESTQLLTLSGLTPKADLGFMLLTPELQTGNAIEKNLSLSLGPDILTPVFSYLSLTERSEYMSSEDDYARTLRDERNLVPDSPEFKEALEVYRKKSAEYLRHRLYPTLPDWPVVCFYPMSKRRLPGKNWYSLEFAERKKLMGGHARIGRSWAGKIIQLITGSTGLDDDEWGVTLFAHDTSHIKSIIYEMRFDPVSAEYAEFGEFYIALQLPLDELFRRLKL